MSKGGHPNEDLSHYHLLITSARGRTFTMDESFLHTNLDRQINAATIRDIQEYVEDNRLNTDKHGVQKPYILFWNGKKLEDAKVKLRKIMVDGKKIKTYGPHKEDTIVVILQEEIGDPVYFESHDIDWKDPDTPVSGGTRRNPMRKTRRYKRKTRRTRKSI